MQQQDAQIKGAVNAESRQCSATAFGYAKKTFSVRERGEGRPILRVDGGFANVFSLGDELIGMTSDGIGTKVEVAERVGRYDTLGFDLLAMVLDDLVAVGIDPTNVSNILDVDKLCPTTIDSLMSGLAEAAQKSGVVVTGGEIAELGSRIGGYGEGMHFNWCATAIGRVSTEEKMITGAHMRVGHKIIALREYGFRSNGLTLARNILEQHVGSDWHHVVCDISASTFGEALLIPSRIYAPLVRKLLKENVALTGIAHITGGGIPANLGRVLKINNLSAVLTSLFAAPPTMEAIRVMGDMGPAQALRHWNMGNGMLLIVPSECVQPVLEHAQQSGYEAIEAGEVTAGPLQVTIHWEGEEIVFVNPGK